VVMVGLSVAIVDFAFLLDFDLRAAYQSAAPRRSRHPQGRNRP
jgi:hypothetical protein